jgi:hypothetical protein
MFAICWNKWTPRRTESDSLKCKQSYSKASYNKTYDLKVLRTVTIHLSRTHYDHKICFLKRIVRTSAGPRYSAYKWFTVDSSFAAVRSLYRHRHCAWKLAMIHQLLTPNQLHGTDFFLRNWLSFSWYTKCRKVHCHVQRSPLPPLNLGPEPDNPVHTLSLISLRCILISYSQLCLGFPSGIFPPLIHTKILCIFLISLLHATCFAYLIPDLVVQSNFLQPPVSSCCAQISSLAPWPYTHTHTHTHTCGKRDGSRTSLSENMNNVQEMSPLRLQFPC